MALRIATSRLFLATRATERVPSATRLFSSSRALAAPWELFPASALTLSSLWSNEFTEGHEAHNMCWLLLLLALHRMQTDSYAARQPLRAALPQTPLYLSDWRHNLEFTLEKMRLSERPISMQLLNRNARRPKKVCAVAMTMWCGC